MNIDTWVPVDIPDNSNIKRNGLLEMFNWCKVNAGEELEDWGWSYFPRSEQMPVSIFRFHFKNSENAVLFKLIWA